jgi:hypothetical protein
MSIVVFCWAFASGSGTAMRADAGEGEATEIAASQEIVEDHEKREGRPPGCSAGAIAASTIRWQGATGSLVNIVRFTNVGVEGCSVGPDVWAELRDANQIGLTVLVLPDSEFRALAALVLAPGDQAQLPIRWQNWCGEEPEAPLTLVVRLSDDGDLIPVSVEHVVGAKPRCDIPERPAVLGLGRLE